MSIDLTDLDALAATARATAEAMVDDCPMGWVLERWKSGDGDYDTSRSQFCNGGAILEIVGNPATKMKGRYWTDRSSRGELIFGEHPPEIAQSFEEAFGVPRSVGVFDGLLRIIRTVTGKRSTG
jgi:hypothetical protein